MVSFSISVKYFIFSDVAERPCERLKHLNHYENRSGSVIRDHSAVDENQKPPKIAANCVTVELFKLPYLDYSDSDVSTRFE